MARQDEPTPVSCTNVRAVVRRFRLRISILIVLFLQTIASLNRDAHAQPPPPSQSDIQAVYLFDFAKFVRWPSGAEHEPLTICVAAPKTFVDTVTRLTTGEHIESRPLAIRAIQNAGDEAGCAILFIDVSAKERLDTLLAATAGKPVLTVSDAPAFLDRGGMIQFLVVSNRVRFSVDLRPAERSGVSLSSELLKVAVSVNGKPNGGQTP
jgi:YfiR/HmsC-like